MSDDVRYDPDGRAAFRARHGSDRANTWSCIPAITAPAILSTPCSRPPATRRTSRNRLLLRGRRQRISRRASFAAAHKLTNILCLPYQPLADLSASLSAADLHVVVMGDPLVGIVHTCKIYNIMCIGAPVLYIGPAAVTSWISPPVTEFPWPPPLMATWIWW